MKKLDLNLIIFGIALASALCFVAFMSINVGSGPEDAPDLKMVLITWFVIFFLPPFIVSLKSAKSGALYGLVIGVAPVIIALLIGYILPLFFYLIFYLFAPLGGYFGEISAKVLSKP